MILAFRHDILGGMLTNETRVRVRYAETDQMGIVYYANYLVWMEIGRVELCRALGFEYREMELQDKVLLTVAEATCRYLSPARYDEEVIVKTCVERAHLRLVTFGYQMRCSADDRKLAKGTTTHIFCKPDLTPARLPEKYWGKFGITVR